jgi:hypothetical protein
MAESLRDQLASAYDKVTSAETPAPPEESSAIVEATPGAEVHQSKITEAKAAPAVTPASAPADERARNKDGTFAEKKDVKSKDTGAAKAQPLPSSSPSAVVAPVAAPVLAPKPRPARPSSWKKEMWGHWDQIPVDLAEYLHTREGQFASGVSTYKAEAESARPLQEAMAPFLPLLQQHRIDPAQWISSLGGAHQRLVMGSPQEKLQLFNKLAQDYGIPLAALYDQQAQSQYLAQPHQPQPQPQGDTLTREEAMKLFAEQFQTVNIKSEIDRFKADEKHKHFDAVQGTMAGLLQATPPIPGVVDLDSAYAYALALPAHAELIAADQEQDRVAQAQASAAAQASRVAGAKGKALSPRSATPSAPASGEKPKGLRSQLDEAYDQHVGGRV